MKRTVALLGALVCAQLVPALAQEPRSSDEVKAVKPKPQDAKVLLDAALKKAKDQKKAVLVVFDASW